MLSMANIEIVRTYADGRRWLRMAEAVQVSTYSRATGCSKLGEFVAVLVRLRLKPLARP